MGKRADWQIGLGVTLLALSAFFYGMHYFIFRDTRHIFIYLIGDIAFVFIEVLLVTLVIHKVLALREKEALLNKLNMVIGVFYSEVGRELMKRFRLFDVKSSSVARELIIKKEWSDADFVRARNNIAKYDALIDCKASDIAGLKTFIINKRRFMLGLLENPNLLEHETFTNLLWAVFHLMEEFENRPDFNMLPETDLNHLSGDIKRAYNLLISEWISYMQHLNSDYPYLFSLASRTNPFDPDASVTVQ